VDGYFEIPDRPGLGVEINEEYLDRDDLVPRDMYQMIQPKM
jgi:L-alanine-DL-glutamate epimerase-like enolase superfamily enzyme